MAHGKKRSGSNGTHYFAAYYTVGLNLYEPVRDDKTGRIAQFPTLKRAVSAADEKEVDHRVASAVQAVTGIAGPKECPAFMDYADDWIEIRQSEIGRRTDISYKSILNNHLVPYFGATRLDEIDRRMVANWIKHQLAQGIAESTIGNQRTVLRMILDDAMEDDHVTRNYAARKRKQGKRSSRNGRSAEQPIINDLDGLLLAERAAILSGRDDEFIVEITRRWCGLREGELHGMRTQYFRRGQLRVEAQLSEDGILEPPKDQSYRNIDLAPFHIAMLERHLERTAPGECSCHGERFMFTGLGQKRSANSGNGISMAAVARHAGVSRYVVGVAFGGKGSVSEATRARVLAAAADLGYVPADPQTRTPHWSRSSYRRWVYVPAATGKYPPKRKGDPYQPVPVDMGVYPGKPVRGRNAGVRGEGRWDALTEMTRAHWNRHSHLTTLVERGIPKTLTDERLGHSDGSVQATYTHVTPAMREQVASELEALWWAAVDARRALHPRSPVPVLDEILLARAAELGLSVAA